MSDWALGGKNEKRPHSFIQWKGTDVCADFYCVCGDQFHIDADFAYCVQCPHCKRRYELSTRIPMRELAREEVWNGCPIVQDEAELHEIAFKKKEAEALAKGA